MNSAFADGAAHGGGDVGGMQLLVRTVQDLTGLQIDHFVRISLLGFYDVAQALGPVRVCLNDAVDDPDSGLALPTGVSTLDAKQALSFVRQRHGLPRGDLDREVRQQYFLDVELRKLTPSGVLLNPGALRHLVQAVGSAVQTDPGFDLLRFAGQFSSLSPGDVAFTTIPTLGTPTIRDAAGDAVSIVAVDRVALPAFIAGIVGLPASYAHATTAAPSSVTVRVVNGSGQPGLATAQAGVLRDLGFDAAADASGTSTSLTTVTYPAGAEAQAKAVAQAVSGAAVAESPAVPQVTLTLGTDGLRAGTTSSTAAPPTPKPATSFSSSSCVN